MFRLFDSVILNEYRIVCDETGNITDADTWLSFRETIGVETVFPHQIQRIAESEQVRLRLLKIMDDLNQLAG
jgi:hypothetical protein